MPKPRSIHDVYASKYLKASDLHSGTITATIAKVEIETFENDGQSVDRPVISFQEAGTKPLVCNKTNGRLIDDLYGDFDEWPGKKITLAFGLVPVKGNQVETVRVLPPPKEAKVRAAELKAELNDDLPEHMQGGQS